MYNRIFQDISVLLIAFPLELDWYVLTRRDKELFYEESAVLKGTAF